jgi:hypothetical protein
VDVRSPTRTFWLLLFVFVIGTTIALRVLRVPGLAAVVIIGFVLLWIAGAMLAGAKSSRDAERRPPKNVTPVEPAITAGPIGRPNRSSDVIVVEPHHGTEQLQAKLESLERLRADGLVTDAEYEAKRAQLIADF